MMKLSCYFAVSVVALALSGASIQAGDLLPQKTADWRDGYSPSYSGNGSGYVPYSIGQPGNSPYGQWSPSANGPYGNPGDSTYGGAYGGNQFPNSSGAFYRGPGQGGHRCHHGSCRPNFTNSYGANSMPLFGYGNPGWGASPYGPTSGPQAGYGSGMGQPFGTNSAPSFQPPVPAFGSGTSFSAPSYPGQPYPNQPYPGQSFGTPNQSYNQSPNSYSPQQNLYNRQPNSFGQPMNSFGPPQNSFGAPQSYGQPGSNFGQPGPVFNQPQSSPFYQ
ncbi:MAG: hypothetical protein JWM11_5959 [Planctomycetaceae bacterium]|nr:hypothetical protein [Planctomycetaceae bacterium]